ncbi:MAG: Aldehyde Dehydrogenase [Pedosphaera sp.]|nr:Aldehyde Dehydrogenase [Pedosphaera sp.]
MKIKSTSSRAAKKSLRVATKLVPSVPAGVRALAGSNHKPVPLNERHLNFGAKWDYAPASEDYKAYKIAPRHELFINGKFVAPASGKYFDSINPATEEKLTEIASANAQDVDAAVKSARRAYDKVWSKISGRERGKYLYRIARIIQEKARELAVLETMDGGKPIKESRDVDLPWWRRISFTTPAGRTSCNMRFRAAIRVRLAWRGRSYHGIFRC